MPQSQKGHKMSLPSNVPELAVPQSDAVDEAEISRCLESAAELVQGFADRGALSALDAILPTNGESPAADADRVKQAATMALQQTATLHDEVSRFLTMTTK
jgi:hypothetical protein